MTSAPSPPDGSEADGPRPARCLQVDVDASEVDAVSGVLWSGGASAVQELPLGGGRVRLVAGLSGESEAGLVARLAPRPVDVFDADHDGWLDAWRPFARPVRAGRVVVHPPWEPPPWPNLAVGEGDLVVAVDPGRAFGAGNHPTTRLAVAAVDRVVSPDDTVLDVGCGSGVLAVVAARRGASRVVAVDVDPEAVAVTRDNARRNGVEDRVEASTRPVAVVEGSFDLVVANILAPVLCELAPAVAARARPSGAIVLSGILDRQVEEVAGAYAALVPAWRVAERTDDHDTPTATGEVWTALTLRAAPVGA